jgi:predicted kinase
MTSLGPSVLPLPKLLTFYGIPGTGKSTIAQRVATKLEGTVHVQTDAVRSMISNPAYTNPESEIVYSAYVLLAGEAV